MLATLAALPVLLLRVVPLVGLVVFAAARFFLVPRFCEPWAALVVNAYPICGKSPTGILIITSMTVFDHGPAPADVRPEAAGQRQLSHQHGPHRVNQASV